MMTATEKNQPHQGIRFRRDTHRHRASDARWFSEKNHFGECELSGKDFQIPLSTAMEQARAAFPYIAMDRDVLSGTPRIAGTRIPVSMVLDAVQFYGNIEGVLESYPDLIPDQIKEAISFAGLIVECPVEFEP